MGEVISFRPNGSKRVAISFKGRKSRTKLSQFAETRMSTFFEKYDRVPGSFALDMSEAGKHQTFGDFSGSMDFHAMQCQVAKVNERFMMLPAALRKRFNHDAGEFIDFVFNPVNAKECIQLGLLPKDRSAVRYVDRTTGKVTNILGQLVGHLDEKGDIVEEPAAPASGGGAPVGQ